MKRYFRIAFGIISIALFSCSEEASHVGVAPSEQDNPLIPEDWKADGITKVVGYRFRIPGEDAKGNHPTGNFTLCRDSVVDLPTLEKLKVNSAELNQTHIERLLNIVFSDTEPLARVACYSPHQIFVFFDVEGKPKRSVEVCFLCNGLRTTPGLPQKQLRRHDLMALSQLCDELGIWADYEKIEDYAPWEPK